MLPIKRLALVLMVLMVLLGLSTGAARADSESAGDAATVALALGTIGTSIAFDDADGRWMLAKSASASLAANLSLKYLMNNSDYGKRPNGKGYGFPSGHAGVAAAAASFVNKRYGWQWGVPAWAAVGYISYVRVEKTEYHRWRDIVAAVAIAEASSWYFVEPRHHIILDLQSSESGEPMLGMRMDF